MALVGLLEKFKKFYLPFSLQLLLFGLRVLLMASNWHIVKSVAEYSISMNACAM